MFRMGNTCTPMVDSYNKKKKIKKKPVGMKAKNLFFNKNFIPLLCFVLSLATTTLLCI